MIYKIRKVICYTTILAFLNTSFQPIYATPPEDFGEKPSHHSVTLKPNPSETHQTPEVEGEKENPGIIRSLASSLKSSASRIMNWFTNDQEEDWIAALQINPQEEFNDALDELKGQPALSERDVVLTLEDLGAFVWRGEISPQDYFDGLNELYATMPCYKKAIESISKSFLRSLSCIVEAQNKAKEDQRFAYEAARELPFSHEDIESIYPTTPKQLSFKGILKGVFQQLCRGFDYVIHNPGKALTLALMGQVAASAAFPLGEFQVNDNSSLPHIYPTTACFPNENGLVAWTCAKWNNSLEWDICIRGFNASTSEFGPQRSLNENTARDSTIIPIGNDTAIIGYNTYDGLNWRLSGRIISDLGELIGDKFDFSPNTTGWQFGGISFVKVLDDFFGAWMDSRGGSWDIWGERFSSNGTRLNPQRQLNPLSSSSQEYPSVGKAPNKSTHTVVWQTDEYGKWSISGGEFFQNSTAVNGTKSIFQNPAFDYKYPLVEILPNGNPFVICHRGQTGNWSIVGGEFDSDMMLVDDVIVISPFLISIQEPYREKFITLLQDYLFITWTAGTETDMDVVGLLLHFNKSFAGPQKTINQFKSWNQRYPSAAGISDSILEVWSGNQSGVYPQIWARFVPITEFFPTQTSTTSSTSSFTSSTSTVSTTRITGTRGAVTTLSTSPFTSKSTRGTADQGGPSGAGIGIGATIASVMGCLVCGCVATGAGGYAYHKYKKSRKKPCTDKEEMGTVVSSKTSSPPPKENFDSSSSDESEQEGQYTSLTAFKENPDMQTESTYGIVPRSFRENDGSEPVYALTPVFETMNGQSTKEQHYALTPNFAPQASNKAH